MRASVVLITLLAGVFIGAVFGPLVGLGAVPLPGIGPPAGVSTLASTITSALLGALSGGFFGGVLSLFVLSIVLRLPGLR